MNFLIDSGHFAGLLEILILAYTVLWFWALVDLVRSKFQDSNMMLIWAVVLIFANPIGPFVYFILARNQKVSNRKYINK